MTIKQKIIDKDKKIIKKIEISFKEKNANEMMIDGQKKHSRTITSKQINPIIMCRILKLFSQNTSISEISKIIGFSRKTIRNNLEKSKSIKSFYINHKKYKICKKIEITYSLDWWIKKWLSNSPNKSYVWKERSNQKYQEFISWVHNFKNPLGIKNSVDVILYYWQKELELNQQNNIFTPTKQTIYHWIKAKKYGLSKQMFLKLSKGLYYKNKMNSNFRTYNDSSKSILNFKEDIKDKTLDYAYEIDLVKGLRNDQFAILTCLNKKTRKLYTKIVESNSIDTKNKLEEIIQENNLRIDQLIIDNGSENVLLNQISSIKQIYRCRPYCSSDKGQIENIHRILRYWINKGISIDNLNQETLDEITYKINSYPRRIFKGDKLMSSNEFENM